MLTLVRPAVQGQDPPKRRRGIHAASLSLTDDEARHLRAAIRNVARVHFGTISKLARAIGVDACTLSNQRRHSAGLALAVARAAGVSVDAMLGRVGLAALPGGAS